MITGILLAAGSSSRFGGGKLSYPIGPEGIPMLIVCLRKLRDCLSDVRVVIRPEHQDLRSLLEAEQANVIECQRSTEGMGLSLAAGIHESAEAAGWIIALGDMPQVNPSTLLKVRDTLAGGASIVVPAFKARRGHPIGFASRHLNDLLMLSKDVGARSILASKPDEITELDVEDPGVLIDVDTRDDLARVGLI